MRVRCAKIEVIRRKDDTKKRCHKKEVPRERHSRDKDVKGHLRQEKEVSRESGSIR